MDPISLTIGVIGLPVAIISTVKILRKTVQSVENAQPELLNLVKETDLFAGVYDAFLDVLDEDFSSKEGATKIKRDLMSYTKKLMKGFENLRHQVQAIDRNPKYYYSTIERITAHVIWMRSTSTIKYLRASLSVARQSIIAFTNIRLIEKLNEELAYLRSALLLTERHRIELKYGMTVERRIDVVRKKIRNRRAQQDKIEMDVDEAIVEVGVHQKNIKNQSFIPQTQPLLQFKRSVNQYVDRVVLQERTNRRESRRYRRSSVLTSESSATTPTQSTQPSDHRTPAPESPPTSPEPSIVEPAVDIQSEKEDVSLPVLASPIIEHANNTIKERASSRPHITPLRLTQILPLRPTQPTCPSLMPLSRPPPNTHQYHVSEPSIEPADEAIDNPPTNLATQERNDNGFQDGTFQEETSTDEQARDAGNSKWRATGAFGGNMPSSLRERQRQRSQSPQNF